MATQSADGPDQDLVEFWDRAVRDSKVKPSHEEFAADLAEEIGDVDRGTADELLTQSVFVALDDNAASVSLNHIREAWDGLDTTADEDDQEGAVDELEPESEPETQMAVDMIDETDTVEDPLTSTGHTDQPAPDDQEDDVDDSEPQSDEAPEPSDMARDELEGEVAELRERVETLEESVDKLQEVANRDMALIKGALNHVLDDPTDIESFPAAANDLRTTLDDHDESIDELEREVASIDDAMADGGNGGKQQKVFDIVQQAQNLREGASQPVVKLKVRDIIAATGCSRRYAYDLMDDLPEEHNWLLSEPEMQQYGQLELDNDERALGVDFEGVHSDGVPVNKFTTPSGGNGGEE